MEENHSSERIYIITRRFTYDYAFRSRAGMVSIRSVYVYILYTVMYL